MPTASPLKTLAADIAKLIKQIDAAETKLGKALSQHEHQLEKDIINAETAIQRAEKAVIATEKRTGKGSEPARRKAKADFQAAKKELRDAETARKRATTTLAVVTVDHTEWLARAEVLGFALPSATPAKKATAKSSGKGKAASEAAVTEANGKANQAATDERAALVAAAAKKVAKPVKPLTRKQMIEMDPNRTIPPPSLTTTPQNTKTRLVSLFDTLDTLTGR